MSLLDKFWEAIDRQLAELRTAQTADDVIRILGRVPSLQDGAADAFFAGGGGDETLYGALSAAGWTTVWFRAGYHWAMKAPKGTSSPTSRATSIGGTGGRCDEGALVPANAR